MNTVHAHILARVNFPFLAVLILAVQVPSGLIQHIVLALSSLLFLVPIFCHASKTSFANLFDVVLQTFRMHMEVVDL